MGNLMQKDISNKGNHELLTIFTFETNNFSEKKASFVSPTFLGGGTEWCVIVEPKEIDCGGDLRLYLYVENPKSFLTGWKTRASYRFVLLNQSGEELYRAAETSSLFCAEFRVWGGDKTLPLKKLQEEGFLENDKLMIRVEVKVADEGYLTGMDMFEIKGFKVPSTQVLSVSQIFMKHPDIADDFILNGNFRKTAYMNLLLSLIERLRRPPLSFSESELSNVNREFQELTEVGFKLDWLKEKLDEVFLKRKKAIDDGTRVKQVEERIKNLKLALSDLYVQLEAEKARSAAANQPLSFDDIVN